VQATFRVTLCNLLGRLMEKEVVGVHNKVLASPPWARATYALKKWGRSQ